MAAASIEPIVAEAGGWIRGVTGASSGVSGLQISIPQKYWTGASYALMTCGYRLSDLSAWATLTTAVQGRDVQDADAPVEGAE